MNSRDTWIEAVEARAAELRAELDRVDTEMYLNTDAITYFKKRIELRGTGFPAKGGPSDEDLDEGLEYRQSIHDSLESLRKMIVADILLVSEHLMALVSSKPQLDQQALHVLTYLFDVER